MTTDEQIQAAQNRADTTTNASERQWNLDHVAYLIAARTNRATYRSLAEDSTLALEDFNAATRALVDEDVAGDDSGEWVRAARLVQAANAIPEPDHGDFDEDAAWRRHVWNRACDAQLDYVA